MFNTRCAFELWDKVILNVKHVYTLCIHLLFCASFCATLNFMLYVCIHQVPFTYIVWFLYMYRVAKWRIGIQCTKFLNCSFYHSIIDSILYVNFWIYKTINIWLYKCLGTHKRVNLNNLFTEIVFKKSSMQTIF